MELFNHIKEIHTTKLGLVRIKRNLALSQDDVLDWCLQEIIKKEAVIERKGKNYYVSVDGYIFTVNAYSYTIITAHKEGKR